MEEEKFKKIFCDYMMAKTDCEYSHTIIEYNAIYDDIDFDGDCPKYVADGCIECWGEN